MKKESELITHAIVALQWHLPDLFEPVKIRMTKKSEVRALLRELKFTQDSEVHGYEAWYRVVDKDRDDLAVVYLFDLTGAYCRTGYKKKEKKNGGDANFFDGGGPYNFADLVIELKAAFPTILREKKTETEFTKCLSIN